MCESSRIRVLIQHGDALITAGICAVLSSQPEFEVRVDAPSARTGGSACSSFCAHIVIADYESGLRDVESRLAKGVATLILTATDTEVSVCRALQRGVCGYLLLGCSVQELIDALRSVFKGVIALSPSVASRIGSTMTREPLTKRETETLNLLMMGLSNKVIAFRLNVSLGTIKSHMKSVLHKLDAPSRTAAVAVAHRRGIINLTSDGMVRARTGRS